MHIMVNGVDTVCPEASTLLDLARQLDLPVEKLVHHYADARVEALVKGEHGRRRSGYNLCQCGSFPGVTA